MYIDRPVLYAAFQNSWRSLLTPPYSAARGSYRKYLVTLLLMELLKRVQLENF